MIVKFLPYQVILGSYFDTLVEHPCEFHVCFLPKVAIALHSRTEKPRVLKTL